MNTIAQRIRGTVAALTLAAGTLALGGLAAHAAPALHHSAPVQLTINPMGGANGIPGSGSVRIQPMGGGVGYGSSG